MHYTVDHHGFPHIGSRHGRLVSIIVSCFLHVGKRINSWSWCWCGGEVEGKKKGNGKEKKKMHYSPFVVALWSIPHIACMFIEHVRCGISALDTCLGRSPIVLLFFINGIVCPNLNLYNSNTNPARYVQTIMFHERPVDGSRRH